MADVVFREVLVTVVCDDCSQLVIDAAEPIFHPLLAVGLDWLEWIELDLVLPSRHKFLTHIVFSCKAIQPELLPGDPDISQHRKSTSIGFVG